MGACVSVACLHFPAAAIFSGELGVEVKGVDFLVVLTFQLHNIFPKLLLPFQSGRRSAVDFPAAANFPAKGVVLKVGDRSLVLFVLLHNSLKLELDLRLRRLFRRQI